MITLLLDGLLLLVGGLIGAGICAVLWGRQMRGCVRLPRMLVYQVAARDGHLVFLCMPGVDWQEALLAKKQLEELIGRAVEPV